MSETSSIKNILVTGGAGFIGSHACKAMINLGYNIVVIDNLSRGNRYIVEDVLKVPFYKGSISDKKLLQKIFIEHRTEAVMHFAAFAYVGESVSEPQMYYQNNVSETLSLLDAMLESNVNKIIFSSTCATYGIPEILPITEKTPQNPINPYGRSKLMVEKILEDLAKAHGLQSVIFRYFNAAGSDPDQDIGEIHEPETHVIPLALQNLISDKGGFHIFGDDYETPDGSCIRDYLHVNDIAEAHILGLSAFAPNESKTFNLGTGNGYSVKDVISSIEKVTGKKLSVTVSPRRPGDPPVLIADSSKARKELGWVPKLSELDTIVTHSYNWLKKKH